MKVFIFEVDERVSTGFSKHEDLISVADIVVPHGTPYLIKDVGELPTEPIESWYIEDGQIKIDQQKLFEFNRKNIPDLSRIEFKYKLHKAGKLEEVEQFVKTTGNFLLQLAYNEAQFFSRTDPLLSQALEDLGWTEAQVDEIWTS